MRIVNSVLKRKKLPAELTLNEPVALHIFMESSFQVFLKLDFHMHISISEFVIPLCCRYKVVLSCSCKEYSIAMQFLATSPYYNPTTYMCSESLMNI